ncbi:MAG TPA: fibronectin type III domain-containing protein [Flavipsychrobacter sp.]|nr:fibronectin type III domain-containing protein [Flavipsychrobacter sp.]
MKKISIIVALLFLFTACKKVIKNYDNAYPDVKTLSAVVQQDGSVKVTGEIVSNGKGEEIRYIGFCMDTVSSPGMISNQHVVEVIDGSQFSYTYTGLSENGKYYFRAWAVNEYGYALASNSILVDKPKSTTPTIPCTLPQDTLTLVRPNGNTTNEGYYSIGALASSGSTWDVDVSTTTRDFTFSFGEKPVSGLYKTTTDIFPSGKFVNIRTAGTKIIDAGASVYVTRINDNVVQITICEAKFWDGFEYTLRTKFNTK